MVLARAVSIKKQTVLLMKTILLIFFITVVSCQGHAQPGLMLGQKAPALKHVTWLKGNASPVFLKGHSYVVEFAATWCAPCRKEIPHLSALSQRYRDSLTIVSIFIWQNKKNPQGVKGDTAYYGPVRKFVGQMGAKIAYQTGIDQPDQQTASDWGMEQDTEGIPRSFLVDGDGRIAWIGHPQSLDSAVAALFRDDLKQYKPHPEKDVGRQLADQERNLNFLKLGGHYEIAIKGIDSLIKLYPDQHSLYQTKYKLLAGVEDEKAAQVLRILLKRNPSNFDWDHLTSHAFNLPRNPDYDLALQVADRALEYAETSLVQMRLFDKKARIYLMKGDINTALYYYQQALSAANESSEFLAKERYEMRIKELLQSRGSKN